MKGTLAPGTLIAIFRALFTQQKTGILEIVSGEQSRKLLFQKGIIKFASTSVHEERLGEYLVRIGKLRPADLEKATRTVGRGERLGQILIRLGLLNPEDLQRHARDHILHIIYACFGLRSGKYSYEESEVPLGQEIKAGLSMAALVMEGVRRMDAAAAAASLGADNPVLQPSTDPRFKAQPIVLLPQEGFLLSRVDGRTALDEIVASSPMPADETRRTILGLWCAGLIEDPSDPTRLPFDFAPPRAASAPSQVRAGAAAAAAPRPARSSPAAPAPRPAPPGRAPAPRRDTVRLAAGAAPAPARPPDDGAQRVREVMERFEQAQSQNLFELLGVSDGADESAVRRAYYSLAKRLHPDRFQGPDSADVRGQAERLFAMLTEAYNVLCDADLRQHYDQERSVPEKPSAANRQHEQASVARQNFMHGKALLEQGQFHNAVTFFENAIQQDGSKAEYFQYLASVQVKNPKWRNDAERNFKRALEIDPSLVPCYIGLGQLYRKAHQNELAERMFRQALSWDPDHPVAKREMASSGEAKAGAGLFKGIFKK